MKFIGRVTSGLGKGKKFMAKTHYKEAFKDILGWKPFEGTLNVEIKRQSTEAFCKNTKKIEGFTETTDQGKKVERGSVLVKKVKIRLYCSLENTLDAAIVLPAKTMHTEVLEIIAPYKIRALWQIKDGDKIIIEC